MKLGGVHGLEMWQTCIETSLSLPWLLDKYVSMVGPQSRQQGILLPWRDTFNDSVISMVMSECLYSRTSVFLCQGRYWVSWTTESYVVSQYWRLILQGWDVSRVGSLEGCDRMDRSQAFPLATDGHLAPCCHSTFPLSFCLQIFPCNDISHIR